MFKVGKAGYGVFKGVSSIFGGSNKSVLGSLMGQSVATNTMNVAAAVVNISGGFGRQCILTMGGVGGTTPLLTGGGSAIASKYIVTSSGGVVAGSTNSAIIAGLANTGYGLGSGVSTVGGASAVCGDSISVALFGTLGIGAGLFDFLKASELKGKDKRDKNWQGSTKIGMVSTEALFKGDKMEIGK